MADRPNRIRQFTDSLGLEIDRLIKQLPGADPMLRGDAEPANGHSPRASRTVSPGATEAALAAAPGGAAGTSAMADAVGTARRLALVGVWLRTTAAAVLGAGVLYWPYAHECGWLLHAYLGVIGAVLVSGCWASWSAWRVRNAAAHLIALVVVYWGIVLAAEQVLPRIGYAAVEASWRCGG